LSLADTVEEEGRFAFAVIVKGKRKPLAWVWLERIHPKKPRVPNPAVLAIRVADMLEKEAMLASDETKFFTEPHYNGYPAVLVRLDAVDKQELKALLAQAWRSQQPAAPAKPRVRSR